MKNSKCGAMFILRLLTGGLFIYHGLPKLLSAGDYAGFVGSAFHDLGLTFLSPEVWTFLLGLGEVGIGLVLVLGLFVSFTAPVLMIIMLGAMNVKGRFSNGFNPIELDVVLFFNLLVIAVGGAGKYSLQHLICKAPCCGKESCKTDKSSCTAGKSSNSTNQ